MACRAMDAESCPNDGIKMHNVNFTKNDVRKVRNVRILRNLRNLTFLSANFYIGGMACRAMDDVRRNAALKCRERDEDRKTATR